MEVTIHVSKLAPGAAADIITDRLYENGHEAAGEIFAESMAIGPATLTKGEVRNGVAMLLAGAPPEAEYRLDKQTLQWLERFKEEY